MFVNQSLSFTTTTTVEFKTRRPSSSSSTSSKISMQAFAAADTTTRNDVRKTNLYDVLNVNKNASVKEIKAAYRSMAKRFHPDASGSDSEDFIEIHNAYAVLADPTSKARYDLEMKRGAAVQYPVLSYSGGGGGGGSGNYKTRRTWETDQCW